MSDLERGAQPPIDHEIDARSIGRVGAWLAVITAAGFVIAWGFYLVLDRGERQLDAPPSPIAEARTQARPPGPGLQAAPELELARLRRQESAQIDGWAWVDREAGVARVPVDEAIERVAAAGTLPDFSRPLEISQP